MVYALRYGLILLYTLFWGVPACVCALLDRSGESVLWLGRHWIRWIVATCGIRILSEGLENIDPRRSYVFMSNHQSVVDIAAIVATIPVSFRFVAKKEIAWIPLVGWAAAAGGHVIIDRGRHEKAIASLKRAGERIRRGLNVIIFPEGTRSASGELGEFKSGGFHLALEAQVPILPVTVSGSRRITAKRSLRVNSGTVKVVYGRPVPTEGLGPGERQGLKERVRKSIEQGFDAKLQNGP